MSTEPTSSGRPLLPHAHAPLQQQRNYVFVDEHNRHKRLKVMRACEGCRRRKIKCDAATTNTWPCAACTRLKLHCVPPQISYENDTSDTPGVGSFALETPQTYASADSSHTSIPAEYRPSYTIQASSTDSITNYTPPTTTTNYSAPQMYANLSYPSQAPRPNVLSYEALSQPPIPSQEPRYQPEVLYRGSAHAQSASPASQDNWQNEDMSTSALTDAMGSLTIEMEAVAPWMKQKSLAEVPAVGEVEVQLPPSTSSDMTIRIPLEMLPSDQRALRYFDYFFANVHPYIPVLHRATFYQQWHTQRNMISPLLLEGIFACATFMLEEYDSANQWLALAAKHEKSFEDVPRLSTIQALVLLLKAREYSPKRGYYYRSWVTVVNMVVMAKDLDLHEHHENHQMGIACESTPSECLIKSRIWNTLFALEINIGGAQGRFDYSVKHETVDFGIPTSVPGNEESEFKISREFAYFLRVARNISTTNANLGKLRKKRQDWAIDPTFYGHNENYVQWEHDLPADMQIVFPEDGSLPWLPTHFIANTVAYHNLTVIMQHRSQMITRNKMGDSTWKDHMDICFASAKRLCMLQEAILRDYGLVGLCYMQRGLSFTIYAVLTCNMLHLAALTSPDPDLSTQARDFFARHMRILEQCIPSWPMPEVIVQINALREAFSADVNKPFQLRSDFLFGSPSMGQQSPPLSDAAYPPTQHASHEHGHLEQSGQVHHQQYNIHNHPITPPLSTASDSRTDSPAAQSMVMMGADPRQQHVPLSMPNETPLWSPGRIFDQWNVAFGMPKPPSDSSSPPTQLQTLPVATNPNILMSSRPPQGQDTVLLQSVYQVHPSVGRQHPSSLHAVQNQPPAPVTYTSNAADSFVTPSMWQDVVASSFPDSGLKRRWNYGQSGLAEPMNKRR